MPTANEAMTPAARSVRDPEEGMGGSRGEPRRVEERLRETAERLRGSLYPQAMIEDVIARQQAERVLRESEARKAAVLDSAQEAIIAFDGAGRIVEFNAAAERMFGHGREAVVGRRVDEALMPASSHAAFAQGLASLVSRRAATFAVLAVPFEAAGLRSDGCEFPIEVVVAKVALEGSLLFTGSVRDVSEVLLAQEALRESEARAQAIVDNMLGGVIMADEGFVIESANAAAARMFGCRQDELAGRPLRDFLPGLGDARGHELPATGTVSEWNGRRRDGSAFPLELSLCSFHHAGNLYVAGNLRDLTALREVERLKVELISTVNHELRTPLTSIRGSLNLLAAGVLGPLPAEARELVAVAERNCLRLIDLINDILDLERLDRGRMELARQPVAVEALLERSREVVRGMAEAERISIELRPIEEAAAMLGDPDRLVQVLVNLLSNAVKFSPAGSAVTVSARALPGTVEVRVEDCGRGIAPDHRELIFERFQQVEASDARQRGGTGLGLAICRSIVRELGGEIGVESELGRGSVFWFRLPAAPAGEERA